MTIVFIVMIFLSPTSMLATPQGVDTLIYKGKPYPMMSTPLESFYENMVRPNFMIRPHRVSTGSIRGYFTTWKIINNELYLSEIDSYLCPTAEGDCDRADLKLLFGDRWANGQVKADWYTGDLIIGDGKKGFLKGFIEEVYERTITLKLKNGSLIRTTVTRNLKRSKVK